jgi:starch-binding outer membrane protein, SusD/RagB family
LYNNMNKIYRYLLVFSLIVSSACSNFIDLSPTHSLDKDNTFQTITDYEAALTGAYGALLFGGYYGGNFLAMPEYMTDNLKRTVELFSGQDDTDNWLATPSAGRITDAWEDPYVVLNRANSVIDNIGGVAETVAGQKNRILGQALALRALAHFDLLRFFGQEYARNSTKLGIIVRTKNALDYPARSTVKETYDQIFADLTQANTLLTTVDRAINSGVNTRYYIDRTVVRAITARVALYSGDYAIARDAANDVITTAGLRLATAAEFPQVWTADSGFGEVIWSVRVQPGGARIAGDMFFIPGNFNTFAPTEETKTIFDQVNDVRYGVSIKDRPSAGPSGSSNFVIGKYFGRAPLQDGVNDNKVFRMGEMYLIRAEANARLAQDATAMADLNALRTARITGYTNQNLTGTALLNAIILEKRKELLYEGHRWFELRRNGLPIIRSECAPPCISTTLAASSPRFILPIPQSETVSNKNVVQNDGY